MILLFGCLAAGETPNRGIYESLAPRHWRRFHEPRSGHSVCVERVCSPARARIWMEAGADFMGVYYRRLRICCHVRTGGADTGSSWPANLRLHRRGPGQCRLLAGEPYDILALPV